MDKTSTLRILIVDDVAAVREDLRTLLTLAGNLEVVAEAANGEEAVRLADTLRPDVILMDLEMPVLGGLNAALRIKARQPACRVVALTMHGGEAERKQAAQAGIDCFVIKGTPLAALMEAIGSTRRTAKEAQDETDCH